MKTVTETSELAVLMDAEEVVEPVPLAKSVAAETVSAFPVALEENVVMTVVEETLVEFAQALKHAPTDFAQEQPQLNVTEELVDLTEPEEAAELAQTDKDAEEETVNVIMTAMKEIVETLFNPKEPTSDFVLKDLAELALKILPAVLTVCVVLSVLVTLISLLLTVPLEHPLPRLLRLKLTDRPSQWHLEQSSCGKLQDLTLSDLSLLPIPMRPTLRTSQ